MDTEVLTYSRAKRAFADRTLEGASVRQDDQIMFLLAILGLGTMCWAGSAREDATDRLGNAAGVLHEIMAAPDQGIPEEVLEHAKCVAVVLHLVKGGFIFGAKAILRTFPLRPQR